MALVKVKRHSQITIPSSLTKKYKIGVGDYLEIEEYEDKIVLKPVKLVHPDVEYFYTKEWQKGESQADQDLKKGDVMGPFDNLDDALKALKTGRI